MTTSEVFVDLMYEVQSLVGKLVDVEIGSRHPVRPNDPPGEEVTYARFSGVLGRARSEEEGVVLEVGVAELRLSPVVHFSGYWRDRNYRRSLEILSFQPVVTWITPLDTPTDPTQEEET